MITAVETRAGARAEPRASSDRLYRHRSIPVLVMLAITLVGSLLPVFRNPRFYYWDDTAGAAVGVWQRIPEAILHGQFPFLVADMWRGGNFAAEAATGMWNPVMLGLMIGTYPIDNVAVAITIAKIVFFVLTAGGVYLLARNYGAIPWLAAAAGAALPLSGWAIFMDGSSWINGTAIMAFTPWAWWALRRCYVRGFRPADLIVAAITSYLLLSTGNPYGVLTLAVVFLSVAIESICSQRAISLRWLIPLGLSAVLLAVIVYLPFVLTSAYGVRAESGIWNDEFLAVNFNDLLGMSTPTHRPHIKMFGENTMTFPGIYLAWFVLPLVPWLRWRTVRSEWRALSSVATFGLFFLLFVIGPSQLGMFRWPARLIPFLYLAVLIVFAVLASRGMERTKPVTRSVVSASLILLGAWIAYSDVPDGWKWTGLVTVVILGGIFTVTRWTGFSAKGAAIMMVGSVLFLGPQLMLSEGNMNVADYDMPASREQMRTDFSSRSNGLVVQIFDVQQLVSENPADKRWDDLLAGNMPTVAGFESTTAYTGIGFNKFDNSLCLSYNGAACAAAWDALWEKPKGSDHVLADLIGASYVVVQNSFLDAGPAPQGWVIEKETDIVTVYAREGEARIGTITVAGDGIDVSSDDVTSTSDETALVSTGSTETDITFGRIAWPGYELTVDGEPVPTEIGPAGMLTAELPTGLEDARMELSFTPPGAAIGAVTASAGGLILLALVVTSKRASRRRDGREERTGDSFGLGRQCERLG